MKLKLCVHKKWKKFVILRGRRSPTDQIRKISSSFGKKVLYNKEKKTEKKWSEKEILYVCVYMCITPH